MKNHKKVTNHCSIYDLDGPLDTVIAYLKGQAEGFIDPVIDVDVYLGYYDSIESEVTVSGWVPMTEAELAAAEKQRIRDAEMAEKRRIREAAQAEKRKEQTEKKERKELIRLTKKYPDGLNVEGL